MYSMCVALAGCPAEVIAAVSKANRASGQPVPHFSADSRAPETTSCSVTGELLLRMPEQQPLIATAATACMYHMSLRLA